MWAGASPPPFLALSFFFFFFLCKQSGLQTFVDQAEIILLVARLLAMNIKNSDISRVVGGRRPALAAGSLLPLSREHSCVQAWHPSPLSVLGAGLGRD